MIGHCLGLPAGCKQCGMLQMACCAAEVSVTETSRRVFVSSQYRQHRIQETEAVTRQHLLRCLLCWCGDILKHYVSAIHALNVCMKSAARRVCAPIPSTLNLKP